MIRPKPMKPGVGWYGPIDGHWLPLLDHFSQIEVLDRQTATDWAENPSEDRVLLLGLEHRNDPRLRWLKEREPKLLAKVTRKRSGPTPSSRLERIACVLGEDWAGHRRSYPLPDWLETFYWHQWYDRVIPWVAWHPIRQRPDASLNPRVGRLQADVDGFAAWASSKESQLLLGNRLAWVLSDEEHSARLWQGLLESYGVRTVAERIGSSCCWIDAELVLIDIQSRAGLEATGGLQEQGWMDRSHRAWLTKIRIKQPRAFIVTIDAFGTMRRLEEYRSIGLDAVVPRPFSLQGLLCTWAAWLQSHSNDASVLGTVSSGPV